MILSIHKKLSMLKNLSMLEPNFEKADGLGISSSTFWKSEPVSQDLNI